MDFRPVRRAREAFQKVKVPAAIQDMRVRLRRFPDLPEAQALRARAASLP